MLADAQIERQLAGYVLDGADELGDIPSRGQLRHVIDFYESLQMATSVAIVLVSINADSKTS